MKRYKKTACLVLFALVLMTIAGCNTIEGMGKDIEKSGEAIQETVK
jgi:predicted small secreted protein